MRMNPFAWWVLGLIHLEQSHARSSRMQEVRSLVYFHVLITIEFYLFTK
jgi:hypothetical protein